MSQNCKSRKAVGNTATLRLESHSLSFSLYQTANANSMQKLMADKASKHVLRFLLSLRRAADNKTGCGSFCRAPFKISLIFFCRRSAPDFCRFLRRCKSVKIHACGDSEAAQAAVFAFQLVAEICGVVVKKFYGRPVRQSVFEVDELADKSVELFNLRQPVDI